MIKITNTATLNTIKGANTTIFIVSDFEDVTIFGLSDEVSIIEGTARGGIDLYDIYTVLNPFL